MTNINACIAGLVKGEKRLEDYDGLRKRLKLLHQNFNSKYGYDNIIFHEDDITELHQ